MDQTLTITRITTRLDAVFGSLIDMSDRQHESEDKQRKVFLSKALAAFSIQSLTGCEPVEAAKSVTDGYTDQGIDAVYFDPSEKVAYFVQSKWSQNATTTISQGDCLKFLNGVRKIISADFEDFGSHIKNRKAELTQNVLLRSDVSIALVLAYTSSQALGSHITDDMTAFLGEQNNVGDLDLFRSEIVDLKRLYQYLSGVGDAKINLQISLQNWGKVESPYLAYYGRLQVAEIEQWANHGKPLFDKNLRYYRPTGINNAIEATLVAKPEHFWYFNNGITILCKKLGKALIGGDSPNFAVFDCEGVSVVNGAQTVGVIWSSRGDGSTNKTSATVQARLISLENCPDDFGVELTTAANTQNPIRHRDFAALDPEQHRLAHEMGMDQKRYAFKSGDPDPVGDDGCNIEDATVALACSSHEIGLTVQAKREVGQLWQDIKKPPYTTLFNKQVTASRMWRSVVVMRAVESELGRCAKDSLVRGELVAVHGNRFVLHRVFMDPKMRMALVGTSSEPDLAEAARSATVQVLERLAKLIQDFYPKDYLANLFKNNQKNNDLNARMDQPDAPVIGQRDLFEGTDPTGGLS